MHKFQAVIAISSLLAGTPALAAPFEGANLATGASMHGEHCIACHAGKFNGDAAQMYLRSDHKIRSADALAQQVTFCVTMLKLGWFPEEELDVGGYLNKEYYKFK